MRFTKTLIFVFCLFALNIANAGDWRFRIQNTLGTFAESERDLGIGDEEDVQELTLSVKPSLRYRGERTELFVETRAFISTNVVPIDEDQGGGSTDKFAELRQLWVKRKDLFNVAGLSTTIGRIRHRDAHRSWLDRDIESVAVGIERSRIEASLAVGKRTRSFRSDKSDFRPRDEDIPLAFGHAEVEWILDHRLGFRVHHQDDRSGTGESSDDIDIDGLWTGVYATGRLGKRSTQYFAEAVRLSGDKIVDTDTVPVEVNARAWSFNASLDTRVTDRVRLGLAYATTSSGGSETNSATFHQTGTHTNRMRLERNGVQFHQLGEAFRADTTNLQTIGIYGSMPINDQHHLSFRLQTFKRRNDLEPITSGGIRSDLIDGEDDIGSGLDIAYQWRLASKLKLLKNSSLALRASAFAPGDAYASDSDTKTRFVLEFKTNL